MHPREVSNKNFVEIARWAVEGKPEWSFVLERPVTMIGMQNTSMVHMVSLTVLWDMEQKGSVANFRISFCRQIVWHITIMRNSGRVQIRGGDRRIPEVFHTGGRHLRDPRTPLDALEAAWELLGRGELGIDDEPIKRNSSRHLGSSFRDLDVPPQRYALGQVQLAVELEAYFLLGLNPLVWPLADFEPWYIEARSETT